MTALASESADDVLQAATLAFAMLRFASGAAHPALGSTPAGMLRLGDEAYAFLPGPGRIRLHDVPQFLAGLPSPALLMPSTSRGLAGLTLVGELTGERARSTRHEFANQQAAVEEMAGQFGLSTDSRILLEFDKESLVISLTVLRIWSQRYVVYVGWNMQPLVDDAQASAKLVLIRADRIDSDGGTFPRGAT